MILVRNYSQRPDKVLLDEKMKEVEVIEAGMAAEMEARDAEYAERVENMRELLE